jgi:hypothetical protein
MTHTTEEIMKPFIDKYDPVGSGIDNVHYWWIRTYFEKALTQNTAETLERVREVVGPVDYEFLRQPGCEEYPAEWAVNKDRERILASLTPTPLESDKTKTI